MLRKKKNETGKCRNGWKKCGDKNGGRLVRQQPSFKEDYNK